jgi:hypothetical protein
MELDNLLWSLINPSHKEIAIRTRKAYAYAAKWSVPGTDSRRREEPGRSKMINIQDVDDPELYHES